MEFRSMASNFKASRKKWEEALTERIITVQLSMFLRRRRLE
jgi:hypothetical protein